MRGFDSAAARRSIWGSRAPSTAKAFALYVLDRWLEVEDPWVPIPATDIEEHLSISESSRKRYASAAEKAGLVMRRGGGSGSTQWRPDPLSVNLLQVQDDTAGLFGSIALQGQDDTGAHGLQVQDDTAAHPVVVEEDVGREPPIVPHEEKRLSEEVFMLITEEPFDGFRSALEDYLVDRVEPRRQHAYVRTVQSWIQMAKPPMRELMREENWRTMVAAALNKLLALPAEEEPKIYSSAKGVIGSVDALRQAIRYEHTQAQKESSHGRRNGQTRSRGPARLGVHSRDPEEVLRGLED